MLGDSRAWQVCGEGDNKGFNIKAVCIYKDIVFSYNGQRACDHDAIVWVCGCACVGMRVRSLAMPIQPLPIKTGLLLLYIYIHLEVSPVL